MDTLLQYNAELSQRLSLPLDSPNYTDSNNNSDNDKSNRGDKYSLRPRSSRRRNVPEEIIPEKSSKTRTPKPKQKPAPLSKYRRKTANARERSRMKEINQAFETLRQAVPEVYATHFGSNEKLTKITTLRLAMKYISTLSAALMTSDGNTSVVTSPDFSDCSDLDCLLLESDGESLPLNSDLSDHSLTPADFSVDFPDDSLSSVDFGHLSPGFSEHLSFDCFLTDIK
ncbi:protein lin-32 [Agrilus planipennis]|uniref:Protein lin-32 n=1 Tax=Agrilus planipennis TaxID=224129 RepID=A0A1W4W6V8_AGRPL|nr:protein lin-32 [Agrilus planipennis]